MSKNFMLIAMATLLIALYGCASLKKGLSKAVLMDYDQVNNFRDYEFETGINWGGGRSTEWYHRLLERGWHEWLLGHLRHL